MTRYDAYVGKGWKDAGLAVVTIVRNRGDGGADVVGLLVDYWCLGVKDVIIETDVPSADAADFVDRRLPEDDRERMHPACARKLAEGAVAYASSLGFSPTKDWKRARRLISGIDPGLCPTEFEFGREGRPCYSRGIDDSDERVDRVLTILEARFGPEGFDFRDDTLDGEFDDEALRDDLLLWLEDQPPEVPRFYELSGMITAMLVCPVPLTPIVLLKSLLESGEAPVYEDRDEITEFSRMLASYWNYLAEGILDAIEVDDPAVAQPVDIDPEDFPEDDPIPFVAASLAWATGFFRAIDLTPDAWTEALARPDLAPHFELIRWWRDFADEECQKKVADAAEAEPSRTLNRSVTALARALRPEGPADW